MEYVLVVLIFTVVAVFCGGFTCNMLTCNKRIKLIDNRPFGNDYWEHSKEWEKVSYDKHMWYLFTFRNPKKLYGPLTQSIWK